MQCRRHQALPGRAHAYAVTAAAACNDATAASFAVQATNELYFVNSAFSATWVPLSAFILLDGEPAAGLFRVGAVP